MACKQGDVELFDILMKCNGIDVNIKDEFGYTPLLSACVAMHQVGTYISMIEQLLKFDGCDIFVGDKSGATCLMLAITFGNDAAIECIGRCLNERTRTCTQQFDEVALFLKYKPAHRNWNLTARSAAQKYGKIDVYERAFGDLEKSQ